MATFYTNISAKAYADALSVGLFGAAASQNVENAAAVAMGIPPSQLATTIPTNLQVWNAGIALAQSPLFTAKYPGTAVDAQFFTNLNTALTGSTFLMASELAAFQGVASAYSLNRAQAATYFVAVVLSTVPTSLGLDTNPNPSNPGGLSDQQTYINQFNAATNRAIVSGNFANQSATASNLNYPVVGPATNAGYVGGVNAESGVTNQTASVVTAENQIAIAAAANDPSLIPTAPQPGNVFQLTAGVDAPGVGAFAFGSPAGNSTIYGEFNGNNTYTAGDNIQASGVNNTFVLNDGGFIGPVGNVNSVAATVSGVQTLQITSGEGITANTATGTGGFKGLLTLNATTAGADTITAAATTNVTVANQVAAAALGLSVQGGNNVAVSQTATDNGAIALLGAVNVGGTTVAAGTVSVAANQTYTTLGSAAGNITASGTAGVTVNATVNDALALAANAGAQAANNANLITVTDTSGAVVVNSATNITSLTTIATNAAAILVTGGSKVTVNETVTTNQSATGVSSITFGTVGVTGNANTTDVTVNQSPVATGSIVTTAVAAIPGVNQVAAVTAAPGRQAVTAVTQVTAALPVKGVSTGTATVTANGAVTIADLNAASGTLANTISNVTLNGYGNSTIASNALTTLNLAGTGGTLGITNANAAAIAAAASTLTLNVDGLGITGAGATSNKITDVNNEISTLNVVTSANASQILALAPTVANALATSAFADTGLKTVTVSGSSVLTMGAWGTAPTTLTVTGAAGYTGNIDGTVTTFNAAGTSGVVKVGIAAVPTKAITAGTATSDEIVINAGGIANTTATSANRASFNTNVTGFNTLGIASGATGLTWNMSQLTTAFTGIEVFGTTLWSAGAATAATFTNVTAGTSLALTSNTGTAVGAIVYQTADTNGANDSLALTINGGAAGIAVTSLAPSDANSVGFGAINVTSNASNLSASNTITTLTDTGLTSLSLSGTGGLIIANALADNATSLTLNNTSSMLPASSGNTAGQLTAFNGSLTFTAGITDNTLGSLTFSGTGSTVIGTLTDSATNLTLTSTDTAPVRIGTYAAGAGASNVVFAGTGEIDIGIMTTTNTTVVLNNTGSGSIWVGGGAAAGFVDVNLTSLTLTGQIQFGRNDGVVMTATGATTGVTVSAGTDNQHISLNLTGATVGNTDTITVGNGNDLIRDGSTAGTVTITAGTGSNLILVNGGTQALPSTSGLYTVTVGADTNVDQVSVSADDFAGGATPLVNTVIYGFGASDIVTIADATSSANVTAAQQSTINGLGSVAAAAAYVATLTAAQQALVWQYGGNTYVEETNAAAPGALAAGDTLVELIGLHTAATGANANVTLVS